MIQYVEALKYSVKKGGVKADFYFKISLLL